MKVVKKGSLTYEGTLLAGAAFFIVVGLGIAGYNTHFIQTADTAIAEVTRLIESPPTNPGGLATYAPAFRFSDKKGAVYEFVSNQRSSSPSYSVGSRVKMFYNPANPYDALPDGIFSLWGWASIIAGIGVLLLIACVREVLADRKTAAASVPSRDSRPD
jgi:hypothetical protein